MNSIDRTESWQPLPSARRLPHSERLRRYLAERKGQPFFLGDWLAALDFEQFVALKATVERFTSGQNQHEQDTDVIAVVMTAMAAELQAASLSFDDATALECVRTLQLGLSLEAFRRKGWLTLDAALSIQPDRKAPVQLTELGLLWGETPGESRTVH